MSELKEEGYCRVCDCNVVSDMEEYRKLESRCLVAEQERDSLRAKLEIATAALDRITTGMPSFHEGNFVTMHYDGDGNELGFEHHDPVSIIQSINGVAESALAKIGAP
jgi:hypothetical protein